MLAFASLIRPKGPRQYFLFGFALEFALSLGSYFSDFKTVILFTILAAIAAGARLSSKGIAALGALTSLGLVLAVAWTAIKKDYREFVANHRMVQIVTTDYSTNLAKLWELTTNLDQPRIDRAEDGLLRRLSYVEFFSLVLTHVPSMYPYENGDIWFDAITRPVTPRLFFPNKTIIDDSIQTRKYTGMYIAGANAGTSVSIGYIAESYIDFGPVLMLSPIVIIGFLYGRIYHWLISNARSNGLLGMALGTAVLFPVAPLETSITKSFGGLVVSILAAWIIIRLVAPNFFPWILIRGTS
jgi:hypothetical protein